MTIRTLVAGLALAGIALSAVPAQAQEKLTLRKGETFATLSTPLKKPYDEVIDGRIWHCEDTTCRVAPQLGASNQSYGRECATAASKVGAFATYQTGDKVISGDALAACNKNAKSA